MDKERILYLTSIPSPFQLQFIAGCNRNSDRFHFDSVFIRDLPSHRKHWSRPEGLRYFNRQYIDFYRYLKQTRPIGVILTSYHSLFSYIAIFYCLRNRVQYFIGPTEKINTFQQSSLVLWLKLSLFSLFASKAKAVFAIGKEAFKMYSRVFKGPVYEVFYSFETHRLLAYSDDHELGTFRVLFSGRLETYRNPFIAIRSFATFLAEMNTKKAQLIISGNGSLKKDCEKLIRLLEIEEYVTWDVESKNWEEIHQIYEHADVLLCCQNYSTWGLPIQEAMAAGMGIISTAEVEAANSLIINRFNGFIVTQHISHIVQAMNAYFLNRQLIKIHGQRSREISKLFDISSLPDYFVKMIDLGLK